MARELGFSYLDTGAMYRASALLASRNSIDLDDFQQVASTIRSHSLDIRNGSVYIDDEDVSSLIRTPSVSEAASRISSGSPVRREMVRLQRAFGERHDTVAEGRDMGTVVFPDADLKVYVVADVAVRVNRRVLEMASKGQQGDFQMILRSQLLRDRRDRTRVDSPLRMAPGAHMLDSSGMSIQQQVSAVLKLWRSVAE